MTDLELSGFDNDLKFFDLFDIEEIQHLQDLFSDATRVASIITYPDGTPITQPSNFCRLCKDIIRKTEIGCANCFKSDAMLGQQNATGPLVQPCLSGGLWDAGASITVGGKHIANWLIGQVRNEDIDENHLLNYADVIGVDREVFKGALEEVTVMSADQFHNVSEMLFAFAKDLSDKAYTNRLLRVQMSDRQKMEEALLREQYLMEALMNNLPQHIYFKDRNSRFIRINKAHSTTFGLDNPTEAVGKSDFDYFTTEHAKSAFEDEQEILRTGHPIIKEEKETWRNKPDSWVSTVKMPLYDLHGNVMGTFGLSNDITKQKMTEIELMKAKEKAEESDRLKSAFLANMSHEIRTPMNGILGFADLLKEPDLAGERQQEYIQIIQKSGVRMLNIINDIIDISKIESGQIEINLSETNFNEQIRYLYTFFKPEVEQKGLQLILKNELTDADALLVTDREKLYAILTNLVKNAIKFTKLGTIELGYKRKSEFIEFFIKDSGMGIPLEQTDLIFERFRQGSLSYSRDYEGSGLGLSISKAYVEMLGGKIWVESAPESGSTFYFTLPFNSEKANTMILNDSFVEDMVQSDKKLKILIVEDDETSARLLQLTLRQTASDLLFATTGLEAIEKARQNPDIDVILMDMKMPEMDGFDATRQIRTFNKEVIIIAQTAYTLTGDREKALEAGCNNYLSKPIKRDQLLKLVKEYF